MICGVPKYIHPDTDYDFALLMCPGGTALSIAKKGVLLITGQLKCNSKKTANKAESSWQCWFCADLKSLSEHCIAGDPRCGHQLLLVLSHSNIALAWQH